ncbi:MAG: glycerate kinase [Maribacter sp.]|uniref:glycerate kinase n=1 Tax=Maribacter sp. TaxID=1897614 RepID=UPI003298A401
MKVLLIPDKFKGSLTAREVIESISRGVLRVFPKTHVHAVQASDGGEGFLECIAANVNCEVITVDTVDALGNAIKADYLYNAKTNSAYIELARASGLTLLKNGHKDVMQSSTFGTGLQIKDAIAKGSTAIYVGLGGSATNDAGLGIAEALGYYFLDSNGDQLAPVGRSLSKVKSIHKASTSLSLKGISFYAVNDVDNPLYGPEGAAYTYAKQKGAGSQEMKELDCGMEDLANLVKLQTKKDAAKLLGAGAAGGTAYGLKVFCDAAFVSGIDFVLRVSRVEELLAENDFDYIITGEGKFDHQTLHGKLITGVIDLSKRFEIPVLAVCGQLDLDKKTLEQFDLLTVMEIKDRSQPLAYSLENAAILVENAVEQFLRK